MFSMILSAAVHWRGSKSGAGRSRCLRRTAHVLYGGRSVHRSTGGGRPGTDGSAEYGNRRSAKTGNS